MPYTFAQTGEYDIQIWLARTRDSIVGGLRDPRPHELTLLVDREPVGTFTIQKPAGGDDTLLDANLKTRVTVTAGPHDLGVTFIKEASSLLETARQPLQSHFNETRHPRITPAIAQVSVTGPYDAKGVGEHAEPPPVCLPPERSATAVPAPDKEEALRAEHSDHADAARVSPARVESRRGRPDGVLRKAALTETSTPASGARSARC